MVAVTGRYKAWESRTVLPWFYLGQARGGYASSVRAFFFGFWLRATLRRCHLEARKIFFPFVRQGPSCTIKSLKTCNFGVQNDARDSGWLPLAFGPLSRAAALLQLADSLWCHGGTARVRDVWPPALAGAGARRRRGTGRENERRRRRHLAGRERQGSS